MDKECKEIFQLVAASGGDPDTVRREDLVRANQRDDHIFEEMDVEQLGWLTFAEGESSESSQRDHILHCAPSFPCATSS